MKVLYPAELCGPDSWIYINHAMTNVTVCEPVDLRFNTDVSCLLVIAFDGSTVLGIKPIIINDNSTSLITYDTSSSIGPIIIYDGSVNIFSEVIDNSILNNVNVFDSSISDSSISLSSIYSSTIINGNASSFYSYDISAYNIRINNPFNVEKSNIYNSAIGSGSLTPPYGNIIDSSVFDSSIRSLTQFTRSDLFGGTLENVSPNNFVFFRFTGDPSNYNKAYDVNIVSNPSLSFTAYFNYADVKNWNIGSINSAGKGIRAAKSKIENVSLIGSTHNAFYTINCVDVSIKNSTFNTYSYRSDIYDSSIYTIWANETNFYNSNLLASRNLANNLRDPFTVNSIIMDCSINTFYTSDPCVFHIKDASIYNSTGNKLNILESYLDNSSIIRSKILDSQLNESHIYDSSLSNIVINKNTYLYNSEILNSWSNVFILVTNASTGDKIYVMDDDTLDIDSSSWRVNIYDSIVWDSSFNNTTIYDSSLYNVYLQDCSLVRCTIYNCTLDESSEYDTRTVLIDASIYSDCSINYDTSTFYTKTSKRVDVGMNGCSLPDRMSAGDYLNWVNENHFWDKVGAMYAWSSAPDADNTENLITGVYLYNPQLSPVSIQYMVFV